MATVDEGAYADKLIEASLGACDPTLAHTYAHHAGTVGDWLADIATSTGNQALFSTSIGSENTTYFDDAASGSSIYGALTTYGTSKGATYAYSTEVVRLERDDGGRATGVIAKGADGSYTRYQASKGVVLATGAYNGDQDMVRKYIPWLDLDTTDEYSPLANNGNTGDGLKMALWTGARIGSVPHCPMVHFIKGAMPMAGSLFVNGAGRRFMDEGTSMEVIAQTVMRQPGHAMYQVGDAKPSGMALLMMSMGASSGADASAAGTSSAMGASGAAGASGATGAAASGMAGASGAAASGAGAAGASGATGASGSAGAGSASSAATAGTSGAAGASGSSSGSGNGAADPSANLGGSGETYNSLDELAAAYDMDAAVLKQTVERWNELVTKGVDEDFGSNFKIAQTIDTPPYSITASPGCRLAMIGGPQVDANLAVLDDDYKPIPGLYAAGNCTCGFYGPNYPMQVQDGIARAFSTVSGYLAAKNAIAG